MKDMVVTFRYVMRDSMGKVLEDTTSGTPTRYLHGSKEISSLLQEQMEGLVKDESKEIRLLQSSGKTAGDYYFHIYIDAVRSADEKELILGYPLDSITEKCDDDCECYKN
jgi:hypothetical protein